MNWTSRTPIENVKCIVETNTGSIFPARYINGTWWNATRAFVIDGVTRWIVFPEGEEPNDYIAPEVLLKHLMKAYKESQAKLATTRDLNKKLCSTYSKTRDENSKLRDTDCKLRAELKQAKEQSQKLGGMFTKLSTLMRKFSLMEFLPEDDNQTAEEIVA